MFQRIVVVVGAHDCSKRAQNSFIDDTIKLTAFSNDDHCQQKAKSTHLFAACEQPYSTMVTFSSYSLGTKLLIFIFETNISVAVEKTVSEIHRTMGTFEEEKDEKKKQE